MSIAASVLSVTDPPKVSDRRLLALYEYWQDLGEAGGGLPHLTAFDALRVRTLLPNIWIVEVDDDTHRFRMRLAGEDINAVYGRNIGGHFFADLFDPHDLPTILARYTRALGDPSIFFAKGAVYAAAGRRTVGERLGLPMLGRGGGTSILLGATIYGGRVNETTPVMTTGDVAEFHPVRAVNHKPVEIGGA